jgi:hypothetical protein
MNNGVGIGYQTNNNSIFYTVEQEVFSAIESQGNIGVCLTAGLAENEADHTPIYPNPSADFIELANLDALGMQKISIYTLEGRLVKHTELEANTNRISIQDLAAGMYLIEVNGKRHSFIKQ